MRYINQPGVQQVCDSLYYDCHHNKDGVTFTFWCFTRSTDNDKELHDDKCLCHFAFRALPVNYHLQKKCHSCVI